MLPQELPAFFCRVHASCHLPEKIAERNCCAACRVCIHRGEKLSHPFCSRISNRPVEFLQLRDCLIGDPAVFLLDMVVADTSLIIDAHDRVVL